VRRALWVALVALALVGVSSAVFRAAAVLDPNGATARLQHQAFRAMHADESLIREDQVRFGTHATRTLLHVVPGALFLALAPLQFVRRIRERHLQFHRWLGRVLMIAVVVSAVSSFYFGLVIPVGGVGEAAAIAVFGALMLFAVARGYIAARRGDVAPHRAWMIRAFAVAIGVSTIRVVALVVQLIAPPRPEQLVVISFWTGWLLTLGVAELWIRLTSTSARTYNSAGRGIGSAFPEPPALLPRGEGSPP